MRSYDEKQQSNTLMEPYKQKSLKASKYENKSA